MNKRKNILSDIEKNYADTKSISKTVDLTSLENGVNPHTIYKDVFKKVDNDTPNDFPTEKISVGDIVYINGNPSEQYEIISINNKNNIVIKNLSTNEVIDTNEKNIKKIMENIDMAKKKINETQYSVSINGLETTDANALSQMMSAAAQADSGNADVGGMDMTSTPELPTPEMGAMDTAVNEPITSVESIPPAEDSAETFDEEPSFEDSDIEGMDDELPTDVENPLDNSEPEMDSFEDDFEPVVDDIEFDEEITPTEDELEMDIEEPVENDLGINESQLNESRPDTEQLDEYNTNLDKVDPRVLQELYDVIIEVRGPEFLADDNEVDYEEVVDAVKDFGNEIEGFDPKYVNEYAYKLKEKCSEEYCCPNCGVYNENGLDSECPNCGYNPNEDEEDEEINEDILLPKATEDETFVAKKKLENDKEEDEESERISESMDALIKSILESADTKSEQEIYAEEISEEKDDSKCCPKCGKEKCVCKDEEILDEEDDFDSDIAECLKSAGIQLDEATVKPTIVTDKSSFANKPNKALKPEDKKTVEKKTVDTATFGKDASEGFKEPLNCIKCEAVSPKEKIKAIYETAKTRYANADKSQWNALDRRYIRKLIESGCGYTRASKIILEAKKKK